MLPEFITYERRKYQQTDRIVPISELDHVGTIEGREVFINPLARSIWGDEDCYLFVLDGYGDGVSYEEVYPEPNRVLSREAKSVLVRLREASLFSRVTQLPPGQYISVGSWAEASAMCSQNERHNLLLCANNKLLHEVQRKACRQGRDWGVASELAFAQVRDLLHPRKEMFRKCDPLASTYSDGIGPVHDAVEEDLHQILLETEFSVFSHRRFYAPFILPIYLAGHILCGWKGPAFATHWEESNELPEGKFLVL